MTSLFVHDKIPPEYADVVELGSDPSAAGGGGSEESEWPRSTDEEGALPPTKMSGTATGRPCFFLRLHNQICGCGGIGRLIGFRFQRASVQVRVLSSAPTRRGRHSLPLLVGNGRKESKLFQSNTRWGVAATSSKTGGFFNIIESCHPHHVGVSYVSLAPTFFKSQSVLTALLLFGRNPLTLFVVYILFDR